MSLINQALRKAQRDRTPNRMAQPGQPGQAPMGPSGSSNQMKPGLIVGLIAVVALLIGVIAGLTIVVFKSDAPTTTTAAAPAETITPAPPVETTTPIAPAQTPLAAAPTVAPTPAVENNHTQSPSVLGELQIAREAAEAKAAAEAKIAKAAEDARLAAEAEAARLAAAQPSNDIIDWLSQAKVTGVRLSESGSKVILNGKAYSVGETVHYGLGLKVLVVQEQRILFIDNNGKKYMKRL
ncbi:MAG: hypothetical protein ACSHX4_08490 [Opitutaceae bacterium]